MNNITYDFNKWLTYYKYVWGIDHGFGTKDIMLSNQVFDICHNYFLESDLCDTIEDDI